MAIGEGSDASNTTTTSPVSQEKQPEQVTTATDTSNDALTTADTPTPTATEKSLPEHVPYVLIGAGTASFACMKAIRERDPNAKVYCLLHTTWWVNILTA